MFENDQNGIYNFAHYRKKNSQMIRFHGVLESKITI